MTRIREIKKAVNCPETGKKTIKYEEKIEWLGRCIRAGETKGMEFYERGRNRE